MPGFAGFDISGYPGDAAMDYLRTKTNIKWCGFYLGPSPSHPHTDWMDKRSRLVKSGWGLAPIYVGQETIGPGSHRSDAPHGYQDGKDAVDLAKAAGFPPGSAIYLDLENGQPFTDGQHAYVAAWVDQVLGLGFAPGVYCSHTIVAEVHQVVAGALMWVFNVSTTKPHPVPGPLYPDNHPAGCGYAGAYMWQLGQACQIAVPGGPNGRLIVDLDTAITADPSTPTQVLVAEAVAGAGAAEETVLQSAAPQARRAARRT